MFVHVYINDCIKSDKSLSVLKLTLFFNTCGIYSNVDIAWAKILLNVDSF
jgi:hypothetical protein